MVYMITVVEDGELAGDFVGHGAEARATAEGEFTDWCEANAAEGIAVRNPDEYYDDCKEAMESEGYDVFAREVEIPEWSRV